MVRNKFNRRIFHALYTSETTESNKAKARRKSIAMAILRCIHAVRMLTRHSQSLERISRCLGAGHSYD